MLYKICYCLTLVHISDHTFTLVVAGVSVFFCVHVILLLYKLIMFHCFDAVVFVFFRLR